MTTLDERADQRVPVTVLTGFLGSGKTTLLNRILSEQHGRRIAVIENEFGEVGVDDALVLDAEEEVFEMNNGCICCTVRGDLIRILGALMRRKDRFDAVIIETTGLADPAPVAQTFFMDDALRAQLRLDAIVTVVDAKHILGHLDEVKPDGVENESVEQIAFADRIVLNKQDLVDSEQVAVVTRRIRGINAAATARPSGPISARSSSSAPCSVKSANAPGVSISTGTLAPRGSRLAKPNRPASSGLEASIGLASPENAIIASRSTRSTAVSLASGSRINSTSTLGSGAAPKTSECEPAASS